MSVIKVLTIPDPILNKKSKKIENIDEVVRKIASDMLQTMHFHKNCIGLAAPQIGQNLRMVVINLALYPKPHPNHGELVLINPLLKVSEQKKIGREGCLSVPDLTANVLRSIRVEIEALNLDGNFIKFETEGFEAVVIQHEADHLDGILFLDRVASLKTDVFRRKQY
ncbi:MAG: peptide deformylase [Elusimicrobia bacterium]|nr:peptide deformylase [Elusimicrobiota bacterium]